MLPTQRFFRQINEENSWLGGFLRGFREKKKFHSARNPVRQFTFIWFLLNFLLREKIIIIFLYFIYYISKLSATDRKLLVLHSQICRMPLILYLLYSDGSASYIISLIYIALLIFRGLSPESRRISVDCYWKPFIGQQH